jgi:hypothetical protein
MINRFRFQLQESNWSPEGQKVLVDTKTAEVVGDPIPDSVRLALNILAEEMERHIASYVVHRAAGYWDYHTLMSAFSEYFQKRPPRPGMVIRLGEDGLPEEPRMPGQERDPMEEPSIIKNSHWRGW